MHKDTKGGRQFIRNAALGTVGLAAFGLTGCTAEEEEGIYKPGTYSATVTGMSEVTVTMTFDANSITDVEVDTSNETEGYGAHLGEEYARQILDKQGVELDAVSGATVTSTAVLSAGQACIDQATGESVVVSVDSKEVLDEKAAYELAKAPIEPVEAPARYDYEADVIIVGSGAGGFNAALRLREEGLSCIVVEKLGITGGASRCAGTFVNSGGHRQANEAEWAWPEYPYNVDRIVETMNNDFNQNTTDPVLLREMVIEGPKCIDWMVDGLGIDLVPVVPSVPSTSGALVPASALSSTNNININNELFDKLTEMIKDAGGEIHTATSAETLIMEDGKILGVKCEHKGKEVYYRGRKAVFLMAGGFDMNRAMLQKYMPFVADGFANSACPPYNYGEVIRMGQGCGADMSGYGSAHCFDGGVWWRDEYDEYETDLDSHVNKDGNQVVRAPWLRINQMGQRVPWAYGKGSMNPYTTFTDSSGDALQDTAAIDATQPGGGTYVCFDSKYEKLMLENYFEETVCRPAKIIDENHEFIGRVPEFQRDWRTGFEQMLEAGAIKKADTIEELEGLLGLRPGVLTSNVEKWNEACAKGEDWVDSYKYDPKSLIPIDEGPYYGAKIGAHIFSTKCGLRINSKMQVIDKKGGVIEGLYAGWHTAGGANGEYNIAGRRRGGLYGDLGQAYVGGFMAANALIENLK